MAGAGTGFSTLQSSTTVSAEGTNQRDDQGVKQLREHVDTRCVSTPLLSEYTLLIHAVRAK